MLAAIPAPRPVSGRIQNRLRELSLNGTGPHPGPKILCSRRGVALLLVLIAILFGVLYGATGATAFLRTRHAEPPLKRSVPPTGAISPGNGDET